MSKACFRKLCSVLDFLSNDECNKGWKAVAEKLGLTILPDLVANVNTQRLQSPTSQFLNALFKKKKREEVGKKEALVAILEACKTIDSCQPASLIEEEIERIEQENVSL